MGPKNDFTDFIKVVLYPDIQIFLQKPNFSEHEDSPTLTIY